MHSMKSALPFCSRLWDFAFPLFPSTFVTFKEAENLFKFTCSFLSLVVANKFVAINLASPPS